MPKRKTIKGKTMEEKIKALKENMNTYENWGNPKYKGFLEHVLKHYPDVSDKQLKTIDINYSQLQKWLKNLTKSNDKKVDIDVNKIKSEIKKYLNLADKEMDEVIAYLKEHLEKKVVYYWNTSDFDGINISAGPTDNCWETLEDYMDKNLIELINKYPEFIDDDDVFCKSFENYEYTTKDLKKFEDYLKKKGWTAIRVRENEDGDDLDELRGVSDNEEIEVSEGIKFLSALIKGSSQNKNNSDFATGKEIIQELQDELNKYFEKAGYKERLDWWNDRNLTDGVYTEFMYGWNTDYIGDHGSEDEFTNKDTYEIEEIINNTLAKYPEIKRVDGGIYSSAKHDEYIISEDEDEGFECDGGGAEWVMHGLNININLDKKYKLVKGSSQRKNDSETIQELLDRANKYFEKIGNKDNLESSKNKDNSGFYYDFDGCDTDDGYNMLAEGSYCQNDFEKEEDLTEDEIEEIRDFNNEPKSDKEISFMYKNVQFAKIDISIDDIYDDDEIDLDDEDRYVEILSAYEFSFANDTWDGYLMLVETANEKRFIVGAIVDNDWEEGNFYEGWAMGVNKKDFENNILWLIQHYLYYGIGRY